VNSYDRLFFEDLTDLSGITAKILVPMLVDWFHPASAIDVGCGVGSWAAEFKRAGVPHVRAVDGAWVPRDQLLVGQEEFESVDLNSPPVRHDRFGLAVCLEVAEHLPENSAASLVDYLCRLSDIVIFSAAIPGQGGTSHLNEQWPAYWVAQFAARGYAVRDVVRPILFPHNTPDYWYAQNAMLFLSERALREYDQRLPRADWRGLSVVHPGQLLSATKKTRIHPRQWFAYGHRRLATDLADRMRGKNVRFDQQEQELLRKIAAY
jgi:hypothetical protein